MTHTLTGPAPYTGYPQQVPSDAAGRDRWSGLPPATSASAQWAPQSPITYPGQLPPAAFYPAGGWGQPTTPGQPWPSAAPTRLGRRGVAWIAAGGTATLAVAIATVVALTTGHGNTELSASGGVHVPTPPVKSAPAPQPDAPISPSTSTPEIADVDLPGLLPPEAHISEVVGAVNLEPIDKLNGPGMFNDDANPAQCVGAVMTVAKAAYAGSGVRNTFVQALHERDQSELHTVFNGVSTFGSAAEATSFVNQQSGIWQSCQASPIVLDPGKSKPLTWTLRDVAKRGDILTANAAMDGSPATCQRALTARRNVVIDVMTCSREVADTAATLASEIAEHMGASA
jgi:serine/threonine kinase PknH